MKYPKNIDKLLKAAHAMEGMNLGAYEEEIAKLWPIAEALVKERIEGERKGLPGELNYQHSFRVRDTVSQLHHWDDPDYEMFLAALLHDIVEDGGVSLEELVSLGFSRRTIELVYLCSHDTGIKNSRERWIHMIAKLVQAADDEAWCIKLVDLADNLSQSHGLTPDNRAFMLEVKAPLLLRLTDNLGAFYHPYWAHLKAALEMAKKQRV